MSRKLKNSELDRLSPEQYKQAEKLPLIIVLDNIRSFYNVGAVFRTADAFRVEKICLCGITAQPPHREIHKTALGATETVDWEYYPHTMDAIRELKEAGVNLVALEQTEKSVALQDFKPGTGEKCALVFGNEVKGVEQEVIDQADYCVEIPQSGTKHSFNIAVSAGIVMWEVFRKNSRSGQE